MTKQCGVGISKTASVGYKQQAREKHPLTINRIQAGEVAKQLRALSILSVGTGPDGHWFS